MSIVTKKWTGKKRTLSSKIGKRRRTAKADAAAKDKAERREIGKTLDVAAFMADFQHDSTSAAYWESREE